MEVTVQDMMEARDRRAQRQRELLAEYGQTLLCFTLNIPGPEKESPLIRQGFRLGQRRLHQGFLRLGIQPVHQEEELRFTGCEAFYVLPAAPIDVKRMAADIEQANAVGRLFDMDVLRPDGSKVERQEIGLPERTCLICGKEAKACARSRTHTVAELRARTDDILKHAVRKDKTNTIARIACQALMYEVLTTPKPGLVDRLNNGSHKDMDVFTFAASTISLYPYFEECAAIGADTAANPAKEMFSLLRLPGRMAEGVMLETTEGINTHRGAIFSIGILSAAAGRLPSSQWKIDLLLDVCAEMTEGLTERDYAGLTPDMARTFGQKLYLEQGITGVRGEAERGFPLVREHGYPKLKAGLSKGLSMNSAGCAALLALMAHNVDTNVIHRGGLEGQRQTAAAAKGLLEQEVWPSWAALAEFDQELIGQNISPGGSADLLAMCYMLLFLEEEAQ